MTGLYIGIDDYLEDDEIRADEDYYIVESKMNYCDLDGRIKC